MTNRPRIYIIDVTNRDGVQTSRICLSKLQKTMINLYLNEMGVYPLEFEYALDDHDTEGEGDEPYEIDDAGFEVEDKDGSATQGPVRP